MARHKSDIVNDNEIYSKLEKINLEFDFVERQAMLSILTHIAAVESYNQEYGEEEKLPTPQEVANLLGYGIYGKGPGEEGFNILSKEAEQALELLARLSLKSLVRTINQYSADILNSDDWS